MHPHKTATRISLIVFPVVSFPSAAAVVFFPDTSCSSTCQNSRLCQSSGLAMVIRLTQVLSLSNSHHPANNHLLSHHGQDQEVNRDMVYDIDSEIELIHVYNMKLNWFMSIIALLTINFSPKLRNHSFLPCWSYYSVFRFLGDCWESQSTVVVCTMPN